MKFDLTAPCSNCPFRTDVPFYLHSERAEQIADALVNKGQTFQCHKTLKYDEDRTDDDGDPIVLRTPDDQHCAGAAIMLEHMNRPNQWMQICERLGWRDPAKLDMNAPVFRTAEEFTRANERDDAR